MSVVKFQEIQLVILNMYFGDFLLCLNYIMTLAGHLTSSALYLAL